MRDRIVFCVESSLGATVYEATTYEEAFQLVKSSPFRFDLIIVDHEQGEAKVWDNFWDATPNIPVLLSVKLTSEKFLKSERFVRLLDRSKIVGSITQALDD